MVFSAWSTRTDPRVRDLADIAASDLAVAVYSATGAWPHHPDVKAAIDSMAAFFVACVEHDDASRHDPSGFM